MVATLQRPSKAPPHLWTVKDDRLVVRPHAGQQETLDCQRRFIAMIAGSQSGKTSLGPFWLWQEIRACGPGDYLAVTPTFPLLKLKALPEFLRLFDTTLRLGTWYAADKVFVFHDGETRVIFGSATHPNSLESATAKAAWLDEAGQDEFRLGSWEAILRRLSLNQGRALITTTPYNLGWLKVEIYDRWLAGDSDYAVIQFASNTNPAFPQAEFERAERTLPTWKFKMFYQGLLSRPPGLIYSDYVDQYREEGGHLVHPFDLPAAWPRYGGLDFGAVHTAKVCAAYDPLADVYYLYYEALDGDKTTAEHAADVKALKVGVNFATWQGGSQSETQQRMDWKHEGVKVREPVVSDVEAGIDRVIALFKTRRLYVFDTLRGIRDELGTYSRVVDASGQVTDAIKDKSTFHRTDAVRYLVQGFPASHEAVLPASITRPSPWTGASIAPAHGPHGIAAPRPDPLTAPSRWR